MELTNKIPTAQEYIDLRIASNMGGGAKKIKNAQLALENSLFTVSFRDNGKLIGFGRIVGDGSISFVVSDIMVDLSYQGQGIASKIMKEIDDYFANNCDEDAYITLIAVRPANKLYEKFGFVYAEPNSTGMIRRK